MMKASQVIRAAGLPPSTYQHWRNFDRLVEDGILPIAENDPHRGSGNHRTYLPSAVPALAAWVKLMNIVRGQGSSAPYAIFADAFKLWHSKSNPDGRNIVGSRDGHPYLWWDWEEVASDVADGHAIVAVQIGDSMTKKLATIPCVCGEDIAVELPSSGTHTTTRCASCGRLTTVGRPLEKPKGARPQHDTSDTPTVQKDTRHF